MDIQTLIDWLNNNNTVILSVTIQPETTEYTNNYDGTITHKNSVTKLITIRAYERK